MRDPHEIAADIRQLDFWDYNLCAELCMAADMQDEWNEANPEEVEKVVSADAKIAKSAFEYAYHFAKKQGDACVGQARRNCEDTKNVFNSYVMGFLGGLREKLDKQCQALVLIVPKDVNDKFHDKFPSLATHKGGMTSSGSVNFDAYNKGIYDGRACMDARSLKK